MNKVKSIIVIGIILLTFLLINSISFAKSGTVNTDTLKLRKEPSTDSSVVELLNNGQKLEILETSGDWYKVKINGMTGYVHKDYVKTTEDSISTNTVNTNTQETNTIESNATTPEDTKKEEDNNENVSTEVTIYKDTNVYILPLINSTNISQLKKGTKVTVIANTNGWLYVETDLITGWIREENISNETAGNTNTPNKENPTNTEDINKETPISEKKMYVNFDSIYVRKGPGTENQVVDTLIRNSEVIVTAEIEDWYKVKLGDKTGYIAKRLLSATKQTDVTSRGNIERQEENNVNDEQIESNDIITTSSKGQEIVEYAKQYLGCKYVYGGSGPSTFDCSGFTMYVYKKLGISLSHSATAQSKNGIYVAKEDLQPGDLVFFKDYPSMQGIGHCGIYIGDGNFIHASSGTGYCVKISTLLSGSYNTRYETARRII